MVVVVYRDFLATTHCRKTSPTKKLLIYSETRGPTATTNNKKQETTQNLIYFLIMSRVSNMEVFRQYLNATQEAQVHKTMVDS